MQRIEPNEDSDRIVSLLRETADGFGCLMAAHVKLARLELIADAKSLGRRLTLLAAVIPFALLGYSLVCLGLAVGLSRWLGLAGALLLVGGMHVVGATSALFVALRRLRNTNLMTETTHATGQSASTLASRILYGQVPAAAAPECASPAALTIISSGSESVTHC
jgi:hypothetical protein